MTALRKGTPGLPYGPLHCKIHPVSTRSARSDCRKGTRRTQRKGIMKRDKKELFPGPVASLPEADIPLKGVKAHLSQADRHQIIFMAFENDVELPEHSHAAQVGFVLEGKIELVLDGERKTFTKGDRYHIPAGMRHSGKIFAGYADITFFDQPDRYGVKPRERD